MNDPIKCVSLYHCTKSSAYLFKIINLIDVSCQVLLCSMHKHENFSGFYSFRFCLSVIGVSIIITQNTFLPHQNVWWFNAYMERYRPWIKSHNVAYKISLITFWPMEQFDFLNSARLRIDFCWEPRLMSTVWMMKNRIVSIWTIHDGSACFKCTNLSVHSAHMNKYLIQNINRLSHRLWIFDVSYTLESFRLLPAMIWHWNFPPSKFTGQKLKNFAFHITTVEWMIIESFIQLYCSNKTHSFSSSSYSIGEIWSNLKR